MHRKNERKRLKLVNFNEKDYKQLIKFEKLEKFDKN